MQDVESPCRQRFQEEAQVWCEDLLQYAVRLTGELHEAEDAVQAVLLKAWSALERGSVPQDWYAWLFTLTHHEIVDRLRHRGVWRSVVGRLHVRSGTMDDPAKDLEEEVRSLGMPFSAILLMRFVYDFSYEEIAQILGFQAPTVRVYAARALAKARVLFKREL